MSIPIGRSALRVPMDQCTVPLVAPVRMIGNSGLFDFRVLVLPELPTKRPSTGYGFR